LILGEILPENIDSFNSLCKDYLDGMP